MYEKVARTEVVSENGAKFLFRDTKQLPRTSQEMDWAIKNEYVIPAFRKNDFDVPLLLKYVDLKLDWYLPSEEAFELLAFIRLALGKEPENLNSKTHMFFMDAMLGSPEILPYFKVRNISTEDIFGESTLILSSREFSKALHHETLIATPDGSKMIGDISEGDTVYSRTGEKTKVLKKSGMIFDNTYEMTLDDGRTFKSSFDHKHILWKRKKKYFTLNGERYCICGLEEVEITSQYLDMEDIRYNRTITDKQRRGSETKFFIPRMYNAIEYDEVECPIDPYTIGVILGDGSVSLGNKLSQTDNAKLHRKGLTKNGISEYTEDQIYGNSRGEVRITCHNDDLDSLLKNIPYEVKIQEHKGNCKTVVLPSKLNKIVETFIGVDRSYTKKVPKDLLHGSVEQRLALLQGLMDTDGTINKKGSPSFTSVSIQLAKDVVELVRSFGGSAKISERVTKSSFGKAYQVMISLNGYSLFRLARKKERETYIPARDCFAIKSFELVHSELSYCITVDCPTQSFLMADGLTTHNSVLTTYFMAYMAWKGTLKNFGKVNFGLYVSDKMGPSGNVALTMATMESIITKSEFLSSQFQYTKFTQEGIKLVRNPRTVKEISVFNKAMKAGKKILEVPDVGSRTFTLKGIGASGGRGSRDSDLQRPQFAIYDDMVANEKDAQSEVKLSAIESTIEGDVGKSLTPKHFKIFIGTAYGENDPVYRRVADGSTVPVVFPRAEEVPHGDIVDPFTNEVLVPEVKAEGFISVWEDRFPYELQRKAYRVAELSYLKGSPEPLRLLNQEFYCKITSERERLIPENTIIFENMELIPSTAKDYLWRITTDFTTTGGIHSDDSAAGLWCIDWQGTYRLYDVSCRKKELEEQYKDVYEMAKWVNDTSSRLAEIAIEIDGQQAVHLYGLKMYFESKGFYKYTFAKEIDSQSNKGYKEYDGIKSKNGGSKLDRLKLWLPTFMRKQVIFNSSLKQTPDMVIGINQIEQVTYTTIKSKHDDFLDILSQNAMIYTYLPSKPEGNKEKTGSLKISLVEALIGYNNLLTNDDEDDYYML